MEKLRSKKATAKQREVDRAIADTEIPVAAHAGGNGNGEGH
jgi:hypothetical protein